MGSHCHFVKGKPKQITYCKQRVNTEVEECYLLKIRHLEGFISMGMRNRQQRVMYQHTFGKGRKYTLDRSPVHCRAHIIHSHSPIGLNMHVFGHRKNKSRSLTKTIFDFFTICFPPVIVKNVTNYKQMTHSSWKGWYSESKIKIKQCHAMTMPTMPACPCASAVWLPTVIAICQRKFKNILLQLSICHLCQFLSSFLCASVRFILSLTPTTRLIVTL